jgi:hypothetical protein
LTDGSKRFLVLMLATACLAVHVNTASRDIEPALALHIVPANFLAECETVDPSGLTCSDLIAVGNPTDFQFAFVLIAGMPGVAAARFGIEYSPSVRVTGWTNCTGGSEILEGNWPASGTGIAKAWLCSSGEGTDSLSVLGYFTILPGSTGRACARVS